MINPNKLYTAKSIAVVTKIITNAPGYWFEVSSRQGGTYEGYLESHEANYKKLNVGDKVRVKVIYSITGDRFLVREVRKVRVPK